MLPAAAPCRIQEPHPGMWRPAVAAIQSHDKRGSGMPSLVPLPIYILIAICNFKTLLCSSNPQNIFCAADYVAPLGILSLQQATV